MPIKLLTRMIEEMTHPETKKRVFELSSWNYSTELPYMALRTHIGFYDNYEVAESAKMKQEIIEKFKDK